MDIKALSKKISEHAFAYRKAINNGARVSDQIAVTKNVLYNNFEEIEEALKYAAEAEAKIQLLELELNDAERELDEKEKELKAAEKKTTSKKKAAEVTVE